MTLPGWDNLEVANGIHNFFEVVGLVGFAVLVAFEVLAHVNGKKNPKREHLFKVLALISFAFAVGSELCALPYGRRADKLAGAELERLKPKPFVERLRIFLDSIDVNIMAELSRGGRPLNITRQLKQSQFDLLSLLSHETGASEYMGNMTISAYGTAESPDWAGPFVAVAFDIYPSLLANSKRTPAQTEK